MAQAPGSVKYPNPSSHNSIKILPIPSSVDTILSFVDMAKILKVFSAIAPIPKRTFIDKQLACATGSIPVCAYLSKSYFQYKPPKGSRKVILRDHFSRSLRWLQ